MMNKKSLLARKVNKDQELKKLAILSDRDLFLNLRTSLQGLSEEDAQSQHQEFCCFYKHLMIRSCMS